MRKLIKELNSSLVTVLLHVKSRPGSCLAYHDGADSQHSFIFASNVHYVQTLKDEIEGFISSCVFISINSYTFSNL